MHNSYLHIIPLSHAVERVMSKKSDDSYFQIISNKEHIFNFYRCSLLQQQRQQQQQQQQKQHAILTAHIT